LGTQGFKLQQTHKLGLLAAQQELHTFVRLGAWAIRQVKSRRIVRK